ncbi:unnamed protein product [Urochloa humidicola]
MAAVKVPSALCFTLLLMALALAPISGSKEVCDEWLIDTYATSTASARAPPGGSVAYSSSDPSASAPKNATESSDPTRL